MKELSIEEKAKAYDEVLEMARIAYKDEDIHLKATLERIFPELKGFEDERIRKELIEFFTFEHWDVEAPFSAESARERIAWLEKQGEKPTNKVEQKIHIEKDKWYVCIQSFNLNCNTVVEKGRTYKSRENNTISGENNRLFIDKHDGDASKYFRPWNIWDAKNGDILICIGKSVQEIGIIKKYVGKYGGCDKCFETYCFVDWDGIFRTGEYMGSKEIHPATEEQRSLLFSKMKKAGYEWDADTKELKKIEQKPIWSEDDQKYYRSIRCCLNEFGNLLSIKDEEKSLSVYKACDWLKSLKNRMQQP